MVTHDEVFKGRLHLSQTLICHFFRNPPRFLRKQFDSRDNRDIESKWIFRGSGGITRLPCWALVITDCILGTAVRSICLTLDTGVVHYQPIMKMSPAWPNTAKWHDDPFRGKDVTLSVSDGCVCRWDGNTGNLRFLRLRGERGVRETDSDLVPQLLGAIAHWL